MLRWIFIVYLFFSTYPVIAKQENGCGIYDNESLIYHERNLLTCLLSDYVPHLKPISRANQSLNVTIEEMVLFAHKMDEARSALLMKSFSIESWYDSQLTWNESDFGNVNSIKINSDKIWTPNAYNFLYTQSIVKRPTNKENNLVVNSSGHVRWAHTRLFDLICTSDYALFPYDRQICRTLFGSEDLLYQSMIKINFNKDDIRFVNKNTDIWLLERLYISRHIPKIYPMKFQLSFYIAFHFKRSSSFSQVMLLTPTIIITSLIILLFHVPVDSNQRLGISGGLLVSILLLLAMIRSHLPINVGDVPIIVGFVMYLMVMLFILTLISNLSFNFFKKDQRKEQVPKVLETIFLNRYLSNILFVSRGPLFDTSVIVDSIHACKESSENYSSDELIDSNPESLLWREPPTVESTLEDIRKLLKILVSTKNCKITSQTEDSDKRDLIQNEWQKLSLTIDRLASLIYSLITIILVSTIIGLYGISYTYVSLE